MSDAYVIEVSGEAAGLVIRQQNEAFRFFASSPAFYPLEGKEFASVVQAEIHASRLAVPRGRLTRAA